MKTIIFTGDSHTCGESADGFVADDARLGYDPKGLGVGRYSPASAGGYTNLVYNHLCNVTGSAFSELNARQLADIYGLDILEDNAVIKEGITLNGDCDCIQIMLGLTAESSQITFIADGKEQQYTLSTPRPRFGRWSFKWFSFNSSKLTILPKDNAYVSFVRFCSGEWTCINSGVGSCNSEYFKDNFIPFNVEPFKADIIIAEAHSINDWLSGCTPEQYCDRVVALLDKLKQHTEMLYLMTVSPILGPQALPFNKHDYRLFVSASRRAAQMCSVPIIDAGGAVEDVINKLSPEAARGYYNDNWHLLQQGHQIYADAIIKELDKIL